MFYLVFISLSHQNFHIGLFLFGKLVLFKNTLRYFLKSKKVERTNCWVFQTGLRKSFISYKTESNNSCNIVTIH